jgi:hypothetical protein
MSRKLVLILLACALTISCNREASTNSSATSATPSSKSAPKERLLPTKEEVEAKILGKTYSEVEAVLGKAGVAAGVDSDAGHLSYFRPVARDSSSGANLTCTVWFAKGIADHIDWKQ